MEIFQDEVLLFNSKFDEPPEMNSLEEVYNFVVEMMGCEPKTLFERGTQRIYQYGSNDLVVEIFDPEHLTSVLDFYNRMKCQALFAAHGFAQEMYSVQGFPVLVSNTKLQVVMYELSRNFFKEAGKNTLLHINSLYRLFRLMWGNKVTLGEIDRFSGMQWEPKLCVFPFVNARVAVTESDYTIGILSIMKELVEDKSYDLAREFSYAVSNLNLKRDIQDLLYVRRAYEELGIDKPIRPEYDESNIQILKDKINDWRSHDAQVQITLPDHLLEYKDVIVNTLTREFTWIPTGTMKYKPREMSKQLYRLEPSKSIRVNSIDDAFRYVAKMLGLGKPFKSESYGKFYHVGNTHVVNIEVEYPRNFDIAKQLPEAVYDKDSSSLFRMFFASRIHKHLAKHDLAPQLHWVQRFPLQCQGKTLQMMINMMDRIDWTLFDLIDYAMHHDHDNLEAFQQVFEVEIPSIIHTLCNLNLKHGNLQVSNIVYHDGNLKLVDFALSEPYPDPGLDCCWLINSMLALTNANWTHHKEKVASWLRLFCQTVLPLIRQYSSQSLTTHIIESIASSHEYAFIQEVIQGDKIEHMIRVSAKRYENQLPKYIEHNFSVYNPDRYHLQKQHRERHPSLESPGTQKPADARQLASLLAPRRSFFIPQDQGHDLRVAYFKKKWGPYNKD